MARYERQQRHEQRQSGDLRGHDHDRRREAAACYAAEEVGRAIRDRRQERQTDAGHTRRGAANGDLGETAKCKELSGN